MLPVDISTAGFLTNHKLADHFGGFRTRRLERVLSAALDRRKKSKSNAHPAHSGREPNADAASCWPTGWSKAPPNPVSIAARRTHPTQTRHRNKSWLILVFAQSILRVAEMGSGSGRPVHGGAAAPEKSTTTRITPAHAEAKRNRVDDRELWLCQGRRPSNSSTNASGQNPSKPAGNGAPHHAFAASLIRIVPSPADGSARWSGTSGSDRPATPRTGCCSGAALSASDNPLLTVRRPVATRRSQTHPIPG